MILFALVSVAAAQSFTRQYSAPLIGKHYNEASADYYVACVWKVGSAVLPCFSYQFKLTNENE